MSDFRPDIWRLQAQLDTRGLVEALANIDPGIRKRAAAALRALGAVDAIPALKSTLEKERNDDVRGHLAAVLEGLQQEKDRQINVGDDSGELQVDDPELVRLINALESDDPETVIQAAKTLGERGDKQAVEPLVTLFKTPTVAITVRLAVAEALLLLDSAPVEVALLGALRSQQWRIRRNGAAILGQLKADWAVEPLGRAVLDPHELVRRTARAALKHIGTPDALNTLDQAAKQRASARPQKPLARQAKPSNETPDSTTAAAAPAASTDVDDADDDDAKDETLPSPPRMPKPVAAESDATADVSESDGDSPEIELSEEELKNISWPKREKPDKPPPTLAPTKRLDPEVLDQARARFEDLKKDEPGKPGDKTE